MVDDRPAAVDRASFDRLLHEHRKLRAEFDRLLRCLGGGAKSPAETSSRFFAGKFEAERRRSPLGSGRARLPNILLKGPLLLLQQLCGGKEEVLRVREASRCSKTCVDAIFSGYKLYVFGGMGLVGVGEGDVPVARSAECLSLSTGTWEVLKPPLPRDYLFGSGALLGGHFYACGSALDCGRMAMRFGFAARKWQVLAPMTLRRTAAAVAAVAGTLYVCGGEDMLAREVHDSVERLDLSESAGNSGARGAWHLLPVSMSTKRRHFLAASVTSLEGDQQLFLCGGFRTSVSNEYLADASAALDGAELISEGRRRRCAPPMPSPRGCHFGASLSGRVFACGGYDGTTVEGLDTVDCYDPALEQWSSFAPLPFPRVHGSATVMAGRLYVLGGKVPKFRLYSENTVYDKTVHVLDPGTGQWEAASWELRRGRECFIAAAVWTGAIRPNA